MDQCGENLDFEQSSFFFSRIVERARKETEFLVIRAASGEAVNYDRGTRAQAP